MILLYNKVIRNNYFMYLEKYKPYNLVWDDYWVTETIPTLPTYVEIFEVNRISSYSYV